MNDGNKISEERMGNKLKSKELGVEKGVVLFNDSHTRRLTKEACQVGIVSGINQFDSFLNNAIIHLKLYPLPNIIPFFCSYFSRPYSIILSLWLTM